VLKLSRCSLVYEIDGYGLIYSSSSYQCIWKSQICHNNAAA